MNQPVLLRNFQELPERKAGENGRHWALRFHSGLKKFKQAAAARYSEATLRRLLENFDAEVRQAAVLALGMIGTMKANDALARMLHDENVLVRQLAGDALWGLWFRASLPEHNQELQRLMRLRPDAKVPQAILAGYETLLQKAPRFAEAYNQRAILHFRLGDLERTLNDCQQVLRLNPYHFGAASGMAQCYMKQRKLRAALRAYRRAYRINPNLDGIEEVIQSLERMLGEGRK